MTREMKTTLLPDGSAFSTALVMSKEEAMRLPLKVRPICFRISSEMYHDVFESVGAASMCWKPAPGSEIFNSEQASNVAVELCFKIANEMEKRDKETRASALLECKQAVTLNYDQSREVKYDAYKSGVNDGIDMSEQTIQKLIDQKP